MSLLEDKGEVEELINGVKLTVLVEDSVDMDKPERRQLSTDITEICQD